MKKLLSLVPWLCLGLFAVEMAAVMAPRKSGDLHTAEFGKLPVMMGGRVQPLDSVARNALLQIRSTSDVPLEMVPSWKFWHHPEKLRSSEWLLEVFFKPEVADTRPIFLIHHPDLLSEFDLEEKGIEKSGLRYYTFQEIATIWDGVTERARHASEVEDAQRTSYQKQVLKLYNAMALYQRLKNSVQPEGMHDLTAAIGEFRAALPGGLKAFAAQQAGESFDQEALARLAAAVQPFDRVANLAYPMIIPPANPEADPEGWKNLGASVLDLIHGGEIHPAVMLFARMGEAYRHDKKEAFNQAVAEYRAWLKKDFGGELARAHREQYYNRTKVFLHGTIMYVFAFLLAGGALLSYGAWPAVFESLRRSASYVVVLAFAVHTFGILFRMTIEGRPPVTSLYSSAVFIGWGACLLGIILERFYRIGVGSAASSLAGFVTLIIAHNLALRNAGTFEVMRAVLDNNFWLTSHVLTITLGYSATFMAGALAIVYVVLGVFTRLLNARLQTDANIGKALARMVYAIVCFATLFSFVGTVLGGIWADQSWGRFWGWDPKENGALLIVLWNAIILHARWGKLVQERGLMNLALFGNVITAFSWFGTNLLGIGLHSYGFTDEGAKWLALFSVSQLVLIGFGLLPLNVWKSFQTAAPASSSSTPAKASTATM